MDRRRKRGKGATESERGGGATDNGKEKGGKGHGCAASGHAGVDRAPSRTNAGPPVWSRRTEGPAKQISIDRVSRWPSTATSRQWPGPPSDRIGLVEVLGILGLPIQSVPRALVVGRADRLDGHRWHVCHARY